MEEPEDLDFDDFGIFGAPGNLICGFEYTKLL